MLGNAADIKRGASPRPKKYDTDEHSGVNWIKIGDTDAGKYVTSIREKITQEGAAKSVLVGKGTLILSNSMSFGRPYILNVEGCIYDGWLAITPSDCFDKEFLYYALLASNWYFEQVAVGTAVRNLNSERVARTPVPLPPLPEQQRIVSHVEILFAKLDEAKEKAQAVVDGFELRKSAILHKAFTGELTERWRKENGVGLESWGTQKFGQVVENLDAKRIPLSQQQRSGMCRKYDYYGASGVIDKVDDYLFDGRYLLIGEDGANFVTRSKPIAFIAEGQYWVNNHAHILAMRPQIVMDFLCYYINSIDLIPYVTGSAQPKLTQNKMNTIPVPMPSIPEQEQIVLVLNSIVSQEKHAMEAAKAVLSQIDTMKKAILARAFRGELGTNDPAEEWAGELLKTV